MNENITGGLSLAELGWNNHFQSAHIELGQPGHTPARVTAAHRDALEVTGPDYSGRIAQPNGLEGEERPTVGDWIAITPDHRFAALYSRQSLFKRKQAGTGKSIQPIAANVDSLFIVTSANHDFNIARLERFLALAHEAEVAPVIVITKADLSEEPEHFAKEARSIKSGLDVELIDARQPELVVQLGIWLGKGQTVALTGTSGVGKSTIVNTLMGEAAQATSGIREDDSRGRHTTTGRSLHLMPSGALLLDTPGMRELALVDAQDGVSAVFEDLETLTRSCRFSNCQHQNEPGCAVREAIETGTLDPARLLRFEKLKREERYNSEAMHVAHARNKAFGKMVRKIGNHKTKHMEDW